MISGEGGGGGGGAEFRPLICTVRDLVTLSRSCSRTVGGVSPPCCGSVSSVLAQCQAIVPGGQVISPRTMRAINRMFTLASRFVSCWHSHVFAL